MLSLEVITASQAAAIFARAKDIAEEYDGTSTEALVDFREALRDELGIAVEEVGTINPEVADLWADALESGIFVQGKGALTRGDKRFGVPVQRCCLGVLCDLAVAKGIIPPPRLDMRHLDGGDVPVYFYGDEDHQQSYTSLPHAVQQWANISENGEIVGESLHGNHGLANANDNGVGFAEIAEVIRARRIS